MTDTAAAPDEQAGSAAIGYALLMADVEGAVQAASDQIALLGRVMAQGFAGLRAITPPAAPPAAILAPEAEAALPPTAAETASIAPALAHPASSAGPAGAPLATTERALPSETALAPAGSLAAEAPRSLPSAAPAVASRAPLAPSAEPPARSLALPARPLAPKIEVSVAASSAEPAAFALPPSLAPIIPASSEAGRRDVPAAPRDAGAPVSGPTCGDVFLDGVRVGTWIADHLARAAGGPARGATGFDPRLGPRWPGALQGY